MKLKSNLLATSLAIACGALALAPTANAAPDGTINITGKVIAPTCSVSNANSGIVSVNLPTVLTSAFSGSVGSTTGATPFALALTGCPTNPSGVQVAAQFSGSNISATDGNLLNTAASGSNVEVQLTNGTGTAINLSTTPKPVAATIDASGNATLNYQAQYYAAVGAVTGGAVQTSVQYTLTYQ
ncbi:MAG: type 1 fimbrial protein [Xanthomonadaceae bacterium]|nr:type 1 fimbrial protein [Xanthomonadaceae bacterium]MDE2054710.1 type 1 fimbrial protein [Xanthomonadaceae bacterium]MDE2497013.1 type 1 fimbrial protein [Xanthomonadaceae bacterium]